MLGQGLYSLRFRLRSDDRAEIGSALAVVRNGSIMGADPWGGLFSGSCEANSGQEIKVRLTIPADGELITGFKAGPDGAAIDLVAVVRDGGAYRSEALEIQGQEVDIELAYLGEPVK